MDTKRWNVMLAVNDYGSFTRAGQILGYTQSGITQMMKSLEREVGFPLFVKDSHGMRLTREAQALLPHVRSLLAADEVVRGVVGPRIVALHEAHELGARIARQLPRRLICENGEAPRAEQDGKEHHLRAVPDPVRRKVEAQHKNRHDRQDAEHPSEDRERLLQVGRRERGGERFEHGGGRKVDAIVAKAGTRCGNFARRRLFSVCRNRNCGNRSAYARFSAVPSGGHPSGARNGGAGGVNTHSDIGFSLVFFPSFGYRELQR